MAQRCSRAPVVAIGRDVEQSYSCRLPRHSYRLCGYVLQGVQARNFNAAMGGAATVGRRAVTGCYDTAVGCAGTRGRRAGAGL